MTLDEAIQHCEEKSCGNSECAKEHKQLSRWLKELKALKSKDLPKLTDGFGITRLGFTYEQIQAIEKYVKRMIEYSLRPQKQCSIDGQELQKNLDTIFKAIDKAKDELRKGNNGAALEALCIQYPGIPIQKQWKPSDEQMAALKEASDEHWEPDGLDPLYTLYQDLKKLRE